MDLLLIIALFFMGWFTGFIMGDINYEVSPQEKQCYANYGTQATWDGECKTTIIQK